MKEHLAGRDDDGVSGVDAERVEVLHVADGDAVVVAVAHDLVLDLLPPLHRLLDKDLGRATQESVLSLHVEYVFTYSCDAATRL